RREKDGLVAALPLVCQQCEEAPCIPACPVEALSRRNGRDTLTVDEESCTGCGECTEACLAGCIFLDNRRDVAICCDLCGGEPQCVALCHSHCLTVASDEESPRKDTVTDLARILEEVTQMKSLHEKGGK
ncbi:4Fe-4S dicluster domain-containing protein, partial [Thermodesulfobacteriota bacterium]